VVGQTHSWTIANSHFKGPVWTYSTPGPSFQLHHIPTPDGTIHDGLMERVTAIDASGVRDNGMIMCITKGVRPINCRIRECRVARAMGGDSGLSMQSTHHSKAVSFSGTNYTEVSHLALHDSGAFQDESRGEGVLTFDDSDVMLPEYESTNEYHVLDSTFARNKAARGAAIGWFSIKARLVVQRCFFEVGCSLPLCFIVHAYCNCER